MEKKRIGAEETIEEKVEEFMRRAQYQRVQERNEGEEKVRKGSKMKNCKKKFWRS